jgi:hypothetical protein
MAVVQRRRVSQGTAPRDVEPRYQAGLSGALDGLDPLDGFIVLSFTVHWTRLSRSAALKGPRHIASATRLETA